jgi:FMN reductase
MHITGISGNWNSRSRTKSLVESIVRQLERRLPTQGQIIDLAEAGVSLWPLPQPKGLPDDLLEQLKRIESTDVLVVGSPVYKGSYSGVFKHFFDLVDRDALRGKTVILSATGGSDQHALVIEHQLRPLFSFFGAFTVPTGIYANEGDFTDYELTNLAVCQRIERAVGEAVDLVHRTSFSDPADVGRLMCALESRRVTASK